MDALRHHMAHHRKHMHGCVAGAVFVVLGALLRQPVVAIAGAVICGASCFDLIRMMILRPKGG